MKYKIVFSTFLVFALVCFITACNDDENKARHDESIAAEEKPKEQAEVHGLEYKPGDVVLETPLNGTWVAAAKPIYEMKCQSCHKLTDERVVGPGWKGVTTKRQPDWIMNMITNVDVMLETKIHHLHRAPDGRGLLQHGPGAAVGHSNVSRCGQGSVTNWLGSYDGQWAGVSGTTKKPSVQHAGASATIYH